jgi:hypothetical protein
MKRALLFLALMLLSVRAHAQVTLATLSGTITDTSSTPYALGTLLINFVPGAGQCGLGNPPNFSFTKSYTIPLDATGSFSGLSLPTNASFNSTCLNSQWAFTTSAQGGYGVATINLTITGSVSLSTSLSNQVRITWSNSSPPPPGGSGQIITSIGNALNAWGTSSPVPPNGAPVQNIITVSPNCNGASNCFFANGTGKIACDLVATNGSATISIGSETNSLSPVFTAADVGKLIRAANSSCGNFPGTGADIDLFPSGTTIATFISSTSVTLSNTASNAGNCTSGTINCTIVWGVADSANVQAAYNVALTSPTLNGTCPKLQFPAGIFLLDQPIVANSGARCGNSGANESNFSDIGLSIEGQGLGVTIFVPLQTWSGLNCQANNHGCLFSDLGQGEGRNYRNFDVNCLSNSTMTSNAGTSILYLSSVSLLENVGIRNCGTQYGIEMVQPFETHWKNVKSLCSGTTANVFVPALSATNPWIIQGSDFACNANGSEVNAQFNGSNMNIVSLGNVWGNQEGTPGINVAATTHFTSIGDTMNNVSTTGLTMINCAGDCAFKKLRITSSAAGTTTCFSVPSGGILEIEDSSITCSGTGSFIINESSGGTFINRGGHATITQGTTSTLSGNFVGATMSESQTGTCSGNAATVTFTGTYLLAPRVAIQDTTSGSTGAQPTAINTTTATVHCNGAADTFTATVYPNPF